MHIYCLYYTSGLWRDDDDSWNSQEDLQVKSSERQAGIPVSLPKYQEAMSKILLNALTLLSIMSCDKLINIEKVGELVKIVIVKL